MEFSDRQEAIIEIVKKEGPITGEQIAKRLSLSRAALRTDLAILTTTGYLGARPRVGYYYSGQTLGKMLASKMESIKVKDIYSVPVAVAEDCSIYDAIVAMFIDDVGTLFVVGEGGFLEGVVSRKDFLKIALGSKDLQNVPVSVIMTRMPNIVTIGPEESAMFAAKKLIDHEVDALPVVRTGKDNDCQKKYKIVGRLSKTSITRVFAEFGEGN